MFDFALGSKKRRSTAPAPKQANEAEQTVVEENQEPVFLKTEIDIKEEGMNVNINDLIFRYIRILFSEPENSLKIIYEGDAYKCPIEGCGKNFRKENLAQMHVKHYHPEYTKYLDSTPNVADLAYARTVGERLDSSPGKQWCSTFIVGCNFLEKYSFFIFWFLKIPYIYFFYRSFNRV